TRRSHAPKPKLGAICTVSWRGPEPSRMLKTSPHRRLRRTPSASTRTFGHSSARSKRRDAAREASCTSMASSVSNLLTAVSPPRTRTRPGLGIEKPKRAQWPSWVGGERKSEYDPLTRRGPSDVRGQLYRCVGRSAFGGGDRRIHLRGRSSRRLGAEKRWLG